MAGLQPGSQLRIEYREGRIEIERKSPKIRLIKKGAVLVASAPGVPKLSIADANDWIRKSRNREI